MQHSQFDRILGILCSVLDAYSAVLFFPHEKGAAANEHYIASVFSLGNKINLSTRIPEGRGLVGWILRNKEPLLVANFDQRQNHLGYYTDNEEQHIKAFMGCALAGGYGALCVDSKRQYSFSEKDQKMLHLFADLLVQTHVEHAGEVDKSATLKYYAALRTIHSLRHTHSKWADFLEQFLLIVSTVTEFSYCVLCTKDPRGESYSVEGESSPLLQTPDNPHPSFPMNHGLVGWVFRNGSSVLSDGPDGSADATLVGRAVETPPFQTIMAVPLVIQKQTTGVLCFAHDVPVVIHETTKDFVRMAAEYLALFLENLYVKCRNQELRAVVKENGEKKS